MAFSSYPAKGGIPSGNTASRPASPVIGDTYYDGDLGFLLIWDGTKFLPCSAPAAQPTIAVTDIGTGVAYGTVQGSVAFTEGVSGGKAAGFTAVQGSFSNTAISSPIVLTITGNPGSYSFSGTAYNGFGTSPTAPNASQTLTSVPQAPTIGAASNAATGGAIKVAFTAGATGGKSITNYKYSTNGTTYTAFSPAQTTSPLTVSGLTDGTAYTVSIKAVNANGDSIASSASNSATPTTGLTVNYLVIAGGGGGGNVEGGGGGGGGLRSTVTASGRGTSPESAVTLIPGTNYTVTVGAGGAGIASGNGRGTTGVNSVFSTITSAGGGGGGQGASGDAVLEIGRNGGCGGGGGSSGGVNSKVGGTGTAAQGYDGGTGGNNDKGAGGGGGTGSIGANGSSSTFVGGNGGLGTAVSITGTSVTYSGGGGGGIFNSGTGGLGFGGGGTASNSSSGSGQAGTANTGGGGAGGNYPNGSSGAGGSGVVILRWATADGTLTVGAGLTADATQTDGSFSYRRITAGTGTVNF